MNKKLLTFSALLFSSLMGFGQSIVPPAYVFYNNTDLKGFDLNACFNEMGVLNARVHLCEAEKRSYMLRKQMAFVNSKNHVTQPVVSQPEIANPVTINKAGKSKTGGNVNPLAGGCNNIDFETGNFTGWTGGVGYNTSGTPGTLTINFPGISGTIDASPSSVCSPHTLVTKGVDYFGGFPMHYPSGGLYSLRLGSDSINVDGLGGSSSPCTTYGGPNYESTGEVIQQVIAVTKANAILTYNYAVVLTNDAHPDGQHGFFDVTVKDGSSAVIPCFSLHQCIVGTSPPAGFISSTKTDGSGTPMFYSNWQTNVLDLTPYIGTNITIAFTAAGCIPGGHGAYAYIDANCGPKQVSATAPACMGGTMTLTAPAGSGCTYSWSGPGIVGSTTTQSAVVNQNGHYIATVTANSCSFTIDTLIAFYPLPVITPVSTNVLCAGASNGSATANTSLGTAPYTYSWTPSGGTTATISGLPPGTYTCVAKDVHGCSSANKTYTITSPTAIAITPSSTASTCGNSNGSASIAVTGGTGAYIYSWAPSGGSAATASNLAAGVYTCTVKDANNCSLPSTVTVANSNAPAVSENAHTDVVCKGNCTGSMSVLVTGGVAPFIYSWSPSGGSAANASGLCANTYTCTVTDQNGCLSTLTSTITEPAPLSNPLSAVNSSCGNACTGQITGSASGGVVPYSYVWSSGQTTTAVSNLCAGSYTCTLTDAKGCVLATQAIVTAPQSPAITGVVTGSVSGPINSGWAYLVLYDTVKAQKLIDSVPLGPNGRFNFTGTIGGKFLIYAIANAGMFPHAIKSYSKNADQWKNAVVVNAGCTTADTADIAMFELAPTVGGGSLSGTVAKGPGFVPRLAFGTPVVILGEPIPGLDVNLEQHPNGIIASTTTDVNGYYHFGNVPAGTFSVYVDVPGLGMVSQYTKTVTTNQMFTNLNYVADSTHIFPDSTLVTGITKPATGKQDNLALVPNPFKDQLFVNYTLTESSDVAIEIYNILGEQVSGMTKVHQDAGAYSLKMDAAEYHLGQGVYMFRMTLEGKTVTRRIVSIH